MTEKVGLESLREGVKTYYSPDEKEIYALTESLAKAQLRDDLDASKAPAYIDLEEGKAFYPEEVSEDAAEYVIEISDPDTGDVEPVEDSDRWREEFSGLLGDPDLGPVGFRSRVLDDPETQVPDRYWQ
jgi:hypothetical protein